jgi:broad specificity phosphatase PhoE
LTEQPTRIPFFFLRHGETDWNAQGLSQGQVEVPLNANGRQQAKRSAEKLAGHGIAAVVCSPIGRAQETAHIVSGVLQLPFSTEADLREASFGDQEGKKMGPWYDDWVENKYTPPDGETFLALRTRVVAALNRALTHPAPVLVIAHGAMFRAVRAAMGLSPRVRTENGVPLFCVPGDPWSLEEVP